MRRILSVVLTLSALVPAASAYDFEAGGVYYNVSSDGKRATVTYSSLDGNAYSGDIVIPATVQLGLSTLKVREIGDLAFFNCPDVTSVSLPEGIISIGTQAFSHCSGLTSIEMPQSMYKIGDYAFDYCTGLESFTVPLGLEVLGDAPFQMCSSIERFDVDPGNMMFSAVDGVLYNRRMTRLIQYPASCVETEFEVPSTVTEITDYAFLPSYYLQHVVIRDAVREVISGTFSSCMSLLSIEVSPDNAEMCSVDGVLYDKSMTSLIQYPCSRDASRFDVPEGVVVLADLSLTGCRLSELSLPSTLKEIGMYALAGAGNISVLTSMAAEPPVVDGDRLVDTGIYSVATLRVPENSVGAYRKAAFWKQFVTIEGIDDTAIDSVGTDSDTKELIYYDLSGRRTAMPKGIVVTPDGRKLKILL